ncbi:restriction endonuclease subunit S [Bacteroides ovatus]|uniref:restriction endonuclease subunit S n=1 Tax=Bacteroides ovatus TaxID=28116 RepID=UPI00189849DD
MEAATKQACVAIIPYEQKIKSYLQYCFETNYLHIRTLAEGGNQPNLILGKISSYGIYLPPISEHNVFRGRCLKS